MLRRKPTIFLFVLLIVALSACNLPSAEPTETEEVSESDLELTITALANGQGDQPGSAGEEETATPQFTATAGPSATPSVPEVTVSQNTNCRTGPGVAYEIIGALLIGQKGIVVGKNTSTGYWIINNPGKSGTCWLFPQYATVSGNTANLQEYSIPPTPTPSPTLTFTPTATFTPTPPPVAPAAAEGASVAKVCIPSAPPPFDITYIYQGNLTWTDKSNNEDGFRIYFNGGLITALPANTTSFPLPAQVLPKGVPATWSVEAFNGVGPAAKANTIFTCP